jgi:hypothetical protein
LRFDPVSLQVTGAVTLLNNPNDNLISYSQPAMSGSTLCVPLSVSQNGGTVRLAGSAGAPSAGVPDSAIAVIDTLRMKLVALWPFQARCGHAVVPAGSILDLDEIDMSTGKIALAGPGTGRRREHLLEPGGFTGRQHNLFLVEQYALIRFTLSMRRLLLSPIR